MQILKKIRVLKDQTTAFNFFVDNFNEWWPPEYSWSGDKLKSIQIDGKKDGLCTEFGPYGFRIDWGRVVTIEPPKFIHLKWQISPTRVPEPDPDRSSDLEVTFEPVENTTEVTFIHKNFQNHGEGGDGYQKAMDSEQGWDYILSSYKKKIESS